MSATAKYKTREEWLKQAVILMRPWFKEHKATVPANLYVTCGWNKGSSDKGIGQCFDAVCCDEGVPHISVSPCQEEPIVVLSIILHEMIHAAVGCKEGHKGEFKRVAKALGLEGKMTATFVTPGNPLYAKIETVAKELGKYPHSALRAPERKKGGGKGGSGWLRMKSTTEEEFTVVISPKKLEEFGAPLDPWGKKMVRVTDDGDGDDEDGEGDE